MVALHGERNVCILALVLMLYKSCSAAIPHVPFASPIFHKSTLSVGIVDGAMAAERYYGGVDELGVSAYYEPQVHVEVSTTSIQRLSAVGS